MSNESTIHIKNINSYLWLKYDLTPPVMNDIFQKQESYY